MMCDLGLVLKLALVIDAKATEQILLIEEIGRMKHFDVPYKCLQDEVRSNRLKVLRAKREHNVADLCT